MPHFENELCDVIGLDGAWSLQLGDHPPRMIDVPAAWEASDPDKLCEGPAIYRRGFALPDPGDARVIFEADAVSFAAQVRINGRDAGEHRGMWSRFQVDITAAVRAGTNEIELEIWKPGVRYPLRECVAGFLPDVCNTFGGIWQSCRIRLLRDAAIGDLCIAAGRVSAQITRFGARAHDVVLQRNGSDIVVQRTDALRNGQFESAFDHVARWPLISVGMLDQISLVVRDADGGALAQATRRTAARAIRSSTGAFWLNDAPLHVRGVLDWGWHSERLCPTPTHAEALAQFADARALGFNLIKLCLFVPDDALFDAADAAGMLLWLELPLWLPVITPESSALALREYESILKRVHHHPSIVAVSLGCELDNGVDAGFLAELRALVRRWMPDVLVCDNSGSSEAYGGDIALNKSAQAIGCIDDFRDYHFYCDPHFFQPLIDHFQRRYQGENPWLFGEFCDADTLRDYTQLTPAPFWLTQPVTQQRNELVWQRESAQRLAAAEVADGGARLTRLAREQAAITRKTILEFTRRNFAGGGYVVTGWRDTPVTTSGLVDDFGRHKFDGAEWQRFNADRVLLIDRERRREWLRGGDRPAPRDPSVFWADEAIELHALLSNGGAQLNAAPLTWRLGDDAMGVIDAPAVPAATVQELGVLRMSAPLTASGAPIQSNLVLSHGERTNEWPIVFVPRLDTDALLRSPGLAFAINDEVIARARAGERVSVWLREPDARFCAPMPFVREAIHVLNWQPLGPIDVRPHLFGIATDFALDETRLRDALGASVTLQTLWRRFDARALTWASYVVDVALGAGHVRISTLSHAGGLGAQPTSIAHNPLGAWMLERVLSAEHPALPDHSSLST